WTASGEDAAPAEAAGWMLFDANGEVIQADTPARWEAEAKRFLATLEDPAALHTWRNEMEATFADLRSRDASLVQRIEDAAQ
ncbi:hypothetical protein LNK20_21625, partial [Bacillus safensis]|uniref:hypothetical protein n=1 Tax=Bacillus safensis TaxID=561879 RepID=UPI001FFA1103